MIINTNDMIGRPVIGTDAKLGSVSDVLFDQTTWRVRWVVLETGPWFFGREALIAPSLLRAGADRASGWSADLTKDAVDDLPGIGLDLPVYRQKEIVDPSYYEGLATWPGAMDAAHVSARTIHAMAANRDPASARDQEGDPNLRSAAEITGYEAEASEGRVGSIKGFVIDTETWRVRIAVISTGRWWWPGRNVYRDPRTIRTIEWLDRTVHLGDGPRDLRPHELPFQQAPRAGQPIEA